MITTYDAFKNKYPKNPFEITVEKHGYIGVGNYKILNNKKLTPEYLRWVVMLQRCYSKTYHNKNPSYIECSVCEEWLNFQNFAKWYNENFYEIPNEQMDLDKDILHKGNKIYNPNDCIFVPSRINQLFKLRKSVRGDTYIGVSKNNRTNGHKYIASCNNEKGKSLTLKYTDNEYDAFLTYKKFKENTIKSIANQYKNKIPDRLYNTMMNYIVEITD